MEEVIDEFNFVEGHDADMGYQQFVEKKSACSCGDQKSKQDLKTVELYLFTGFLHVRPEKCGNRRGERQTAGLSVFSVISIVS